MCSAPDQNAARQQEQVLQNRPSPEHGSSKALDEWRSYVGDCNGLEELWLDAASRLTANDRFRAEEGVRCTTCSDPGQDRRAGRPLPECVANRAGVFKDRRSRRRYAWVQFEALAAAAATSTVTLVRIVGRRSTSGTRADASRGDPHADAGADEVTQSRRASRLSIPSPARRVSSARAPSARSDRTRTVPRPGAGHR